MEPGSAHGAAQPLGDGAAQPYGEAQERGDAPGEVPGGGAVGGDTCPPQGTPGAAPAEARVGVHGQRISAAEIQLVQNLVERCLQVCASHTAVGRGCFGGRHASLCASPTAPCVCAARDSDSPCLWRCTPQLYMNQREVVAILHQHARVEPDFTALVWEKLEEQNGEFFTAYYTRLRLKDQILAFNTLLEQHAGLLDKVQAGGGHALPLPGGHEAGAMTPMQRGGALGGMGAAAAAAAAAAGEAKLSSSGLLLDRTGAFLSAGDYLMDGPHGHHHHLGHTPPLGAGGLGAVPMQHHLHHHGGHHGVAHLADPHDNSHFLHNLPRNFSLSDLSVEMAAQLNGDVPEGTGPGHLGALGSLVGLDTPGGGWDAQHLLNGGGASHPR